MIPLSKFTNILKKYTSLCLLNIIQSLGTNVSVKNVTYYLINIFFERKSSLFSILANFYSLKIKHFPRAIFCLAF